MSAALRLQIDDGAHPITISYAAGSPVDQAPAQDAVPMLSPDAYVKLLKDLVTTGELAQKHMGIFALPLEPTLKIVTNNLQGDFETQSTVEKPIGQRDMLVFDPQIHTASTALKTLRMISSALDLGRRDLSADDFGKIARGDLKEIIGIEGAGVWMTPEKKVRQDYVAADGFNFTVKEGTTRLVMDLPVNQDTNIPFKWDVQGFAMRGGGTIAIKPEELPELIKDLERIERGECTAQDALMNPDGTAKHDVYGMFAGFRASQYGNVPQGKIPAAEGFVAEARQAVQGMNP